MKQFVGLRVTLLAALVSYLLQVGVCFAAGSISWDEVRPQIAKDDPFLAAYITKNFEMSSGGSAWTVGRDKDGNSLVSGVGVGARIPPFEFHAKPKGKGGNYTLDLIFNYNLYENGHTKLWDLTLRKKLPSE